MAGSGRIAVGTLITEEAPHTTVRFARIRLPPCMSDGKAHTRPWMKDTRRGEPVVHQPSHPSHNVRFVARAPLSMPEASRVPTVGRYGMIVE